MKEINKDVKWFIGVVIVLVVAAVVVGSVYISRTGEAAAKNEAIENAFEDAKRDMAESYDPLLAEYIELQEVIESDNQRNEIAYEMILSWPNMTAVYHRLYEEVVRAAVWEDDALEESIHRIYEESLDRAERVSLVLPEEIWIERQGRRNWTVKNPEDFSFVIPTDPTTVIAEDLQRMMDFMNFTLDSEELPEESLAKELVDILMEDGFFHQYTFEYTPITDQNTYRMTMAYNEFNEGVLEDLRREERVHRSELTALTSREELLDIFRQKIIENANSIALVHSLELREYDGSANGGFGYELLHTSAHPEEFSDKLVEGGSIYPIPQFDLEGLKRYYLSTQVDDILERAEPRWMNEFSEASPLSIEVFADEIALLIVENRELIIRIYDLDTGSLQDEAVLAEEYALSLDEESIEDSDYRIKKHLEYYIIEDRRVANEIRVAENREDGLFLHPGVPIETDPENQKDTEEVLLYNETLYWIKTYQEDEPHQNFSVSVENLTENTLKDVVYQQENMSGGHFISQKHGVMLLYPAADVVEEGMTPENDISIYDFEQQEIRDGDLFPEELQHVWIDQAVPIDEDRLLIVTKDRELWEWNLEEESIELSELTNELERVSEATEPGEITRDELQLFPMEQGYHFLAIRRISDEGIISSSSMIVRDEENRLHPVLKVHYSKDENRRTLNYLAGHDLLLAATESLVQDSAQKEITLLDIDYNQLDQAEEFIELESIEGLLSEGYAVELINYIEMNTGDGDFFSTTDRLLQGSGIGSSGDMHFNRETGELLMKNTIGDDPMSGFLRLFTPREFERETLPFWGFDQLYINTENRLVYYQDERKMLVFDLEDFIPALVRE